MKNIQLTPYKENIFKKIKNFFKKIFKKQEFNPNEVSVIEERLVSTSNPILQEEETNQKDEAYDRKKILKIRTQFENDEIDVDDLSEEEIDELINLYNEETEIIKQKTEITQEETKAIKADTKAIEMETELINRKNDTMRKEIERLKNQIQESA